MTRKRRDYRAEEARRNALAKELGFKNRAELRRAIERGDRLARGKVTRPSTIAAQERLKGAAKPTTFDALWKRVPKEQRAREWSTLFAKHESATYESSGNSAIARSKRRYIKLYGREMYTDLYIAAFVSGKRRYIHVRHRGGSPELHEWLSEVVDYIDDSGYDERYR